jgi:fluoride exporter
VPASRAWSATLCAGERVRLIVSIGIGSAIGGMARFLIGTAVQQRMGSGFPFGTLLINITGSLVLGFVLRYALETPSISTEARAFLTTGFCGGYTTFSAFSYETATLIEDGDYRRATIYVLASVGVSLLGVFVGFAGARALIAFREQV